MALTSSQGISIVYDNEGDGEPALLFLPGWCANRSVFQEVFSRCARYRQCLTLDWRGHGESGIASTEFGEDQLVEDALAVINASRVTKVIPVALAHAGWVALKLRQRLGPQVPKLIHLDWLVLDPPIGFYQSLEGMQSPEKWTEAVNRIFELWIHGTDNRALVRFVREEMGAYGYKMWSRAAREIRAAYAQAGNPLKAMLKLNPPLPILHLYAQPRDPNYFMVQQLFAQSHPWFYVERLKAQSHFPVLEVPEEIASAIEQFVKKP